MVFFFYICRCQDTYFGVTPQTQRNQLVKSAVTNHFYTNCTRAVKKIKRFFFCFFFQAFLCFKKTVQYIRLEFSRFNKTRFIARFLWIFSKNSQPKDSQFLKFCFIHSTHKAFALHLINILLNNIEFLWVINIVMKFNSTIRTTFEYYAPERYILLWTDQIWFEFVFCLLKKGRIISIKKINIRRNG